jgi:RNA polymerase sigma factor (sigma-70 family)
MRDVVEVLNESRDRFVSFLTRRVDSREAAEEILQAAFLKIVAKGARPRNAERVEAWFYRILRNEVIDHYRRRGAEARGLQTLARGSDSAADPDQELDRAICACIRDVIPTLKPEYADILRRADLEEGSLTEVARHLDLTANNATVRLHRARAALRKRLGEVCGACTEHGCLSCACRRKGRPESRPSGNHGGHL